MKRRTLLQMLAGSVAAAGLVGLQRLEVAARKGERLVRRAVAVPPDILRRIRSRTQPFDPSTLDEPHDLAG